MTFAKYKEIKYNDTYDFIHLLKNKYRHFSKSVEDFVKFAHQKADQSTQSKVQIYLLC